MKSIFTTRMNLPIESSDDEKLQKESNMPINFPDYYVDTKYEKQWVDKPKNYVKKMVKINIMSNTFTNVGFLGAMEEEGPRMCVQENLKYRKYFWILTDKQFKEYSKARILNKYLNWYLDNLSVEKMKKIKLTFLNERAITMINERYNIWTKGEIYSSRDMTYRLVKCIKDLNVVGTRLFVRTQETINTNIIFYAWVEGNIFRTLQLDNLNEDKDFIEWMKYEGFKYIKYSIVKVAKSYILNDQSITSIVLKNKKYVPYLEVESNNENESHMIKTRFPIKINRYYNYDKMIDITIPQKIRVEKETGFWPREIKKIKIDKQLDDCVDDV